MAVIQVVGTNLNLAKVNLVPCMSEAALSFSYFGQREDRLDSLAHIESITDAYSQYFVNDIEHTENNKYQKCKLSPVPINF